MKYNLFSLLITTALALSNCSKTALPSPEPNPIDPIDTVQHVIELGKVSLKRDGQTWERPFMAKYFKNGDKDYFTIWTEFTDANLIKETFVIKDIPCKIGVFIPERGTNSTVGNGVPQTSIGWILDGDQVVGGLATDTLKLGNMITLIRYDSLNKIAEGTFSYFMVNSNSYPNELGLPNAMHITEGKFHLKLQ